MYGMYRRLFAFYESNFAIWFLRTNAILWKGGGASPICNSWNGHMTGCLVQKEFNFVEVFSHVKLEILQNWVLKYFADNTVNFCKQCWAYTFIHFRALIYVHSKIQQQSRFFFSFFHSIDPFQYVFPFHCLTKNCLSFSNVSCQNHTNF